jgi:hypothetical protein
LGDFLDQKPPSEEAINYEKQRQKALDIISKNTAVKVNKIVNYARRQSRLDMPGLTAGESTQKPLNVCFYFNINTD